MRSDFAETTALKIMNTKLRGICREAVYELSDAELAILRDQLKTWTVGMSQILATQIGVVESQQLIHETLKLSEVERIQLARDANASLERDETPSHEEFAAYILSNHSDQLHVEAEIKRRESLN
ncbi:MAG: hypothetical protein ACX939_05270 [Hyphococcus sp.]